MSVVAIDLVPATWSHKRIVAMVCRYLDRQDFQILSWGPSRVGQKNHKAVYFEISKGLKTKSTLAKLMRMKEGPFHSFRPDKVPKNPRMISRFLNSKQRKELGITVSTPPKAFTATLQALLYELQMKYNGLYNLSAKYEHKLLANITKVIYKRMTSSYAAEPDCCDTTIRFTKLYRKHILHSGDLAMVQQCLASVQKEMGLPITELAEGDLIQKEFVHNDLGELKAACTMFANKIRKETLQHIASFDTICSNDESTEEVARKKIRLELQNIKPYLTDIIGQVMNNNFRNDLVNSKIRKILIIGEPFLPEDGKLDSFLLRLKAMNKQMSTTNYNIAEFVVPKSSSAQIMSMDSTVCAGAKLLIRPADTTPMFQIPPSIYNEIDAYLERRDIHMQLKNQTKAGH